MAPARRAVDRSEQGIVMSSPAAMLSAIVVALAGIAYLATGEPAAPQRAALVAAPHGVERQVVLEARKVEPAVRRGEVYVEVYNNSNVTGLAGRTGERISGAGWQVVGTDNWYGTIPATTVYYPPRLRAAALLLGQDLGIERILPAVEPMNMDRLTLVLTADFG